MAFLALPSAPTEGPWEGSFSPWRAPLSICSLSPGERVENEISTTPPAEPPRDLLRQGRSAPDASTAPARQRGSEGSCFLRNPSWLYKAGSRGWLGPDVI